MRKFLVLLGMLMLGVLANIDGYVAISDKVTSINFDVKGDVKVSSEQYVKFKKNINTGVTLLLDKESNNSVAYVDILEF
jgi:hypothetical protein